jgi:hypothetical protein
MERHRPENVVRGPAVAAALVACALSAFAVAPDQHQAAWRAYLLDVADRGSAVEKITVGRPPPLAAASWLRVTTATNAYATNCFLRIPDGGTDQTNMWCATNYSIASSLLPATNMVATTPAGMLSDYPWLQSAYTQSFTSADLIYQSDLALFEMIDAGVFLDTNAIGAAGGLADYFDSYPTTNWYWMDTDSSAIEEWIFGDEDEPGDTWVAFPQHPKELPALTRSNAWKYAGLESVPESVTVWTNTEPEIIYGWQEGNLHTYCRTNTTPRVFTNWSFRYTFARAPTNDEYRAEISQARIGPISTWATTNVSGGVTSVVDWHTAALVWAISPVTVPQPYIPPKYWSNAGARAYFTLPLHSNQPAPAITVNLEGSVARWPTELSQQGTATVAWATGTNGVQLSQAFYAVGVITSDWRVVESSEDTNSLIGATCSIVYTNSIATLGGWEGFRSPITGGAWSQRVTVLSYLTISRRPLNWWDESGSQAAWSWNVTTGNGGENDGWDRQHTLQKSPWGTDPICDPETVLNEYTSGTDEGWDACGPDGLVNPGFYASLGVNSKLYPRAWWAEGSRRCYDLFVTNYQQYIAHQSWWACDKNERYWYDYKKAEWRIQTDASWPVSVNLYVTNMWTGAVANVALVNRFLQRWQSGQFEDRVGGYTFTEGLPNGAVWPYYDQRNAELFWEGGYTPAKPFPAAYPFEWTDYEDDSTNDLVLAWQLVRRTNWVTIAADPLPAFTNKLVVTWAATKAAGVSNLSSGALSAWPTDVPPLPFVAEWTVNNTMSDSYLTNYVDGSWEGRNGTFKWVEHEMRESTMPTSEGQHRELESVNLLFEWGFINRAAAYW